MHTGTMATKFRKVFYEEDVQTAKAQFEDCITFLEHTSRMLMVQFTDDSEFVYYI